MVNRQSSFWDEKTLAHGQGKLTKQKEMRIGWVESFLFSRHHGGTFNYIDLNAGDGFNWKARIRGTPLTAVDNLNKAEVRDYAAYFVDKRKEAIKKLEGKISADYRHHFFPGVDNGVFLRTILPNLIPVRSHGLIMCDPNGPSHAPFADIVSTMPIYSNLDLLMYWPAIDFKRGWGARANPDAIVKRGPATFGHPKNWRHAPKLKDFIESCQRRYWCISPLGKIQRFLIVGTNNPYVKNSKGKIVPLAYPPYGFHDVAAEEGRRLVNLADTIKEKNKKGASYASAPARGDISADG